MSKRERKRKIKPKSKEHCKEEEGKGKEEVQKKYLPSGFAVGFLVSCGISSVGVSDTSGKIKLKT